MIMADALLVLGQEMTAEARALHLPRAQGPVDVNNFLLARSEWNARVRWYVSGVRYDKSRLLCCVQLEKFGRMIAGRIPMMGGMRTFLWCGVSAGLALGRGIA
jgi:hypothetical protein